MQNCGSCFAAEQFVGIIGGKIPFDPQNTEKYYNKPAGWNLAEGIRLCTDADSDICGFPGWLAVRLQAVIIAACNLLCRKSVKRSA